MKRRGWLLLAIGDYIEPIQLQKTMFKFAQEAKAPVAERYEFHPYNWGPMASAIYADLGLLRAAGLVEYVPSGLGWSAYRLTPEGEKRAARLKDGAPAKLVAALDRIRDWVKSRSFQKLLRDVYRDYPEYAERSLFKP